MSAAFHKRLRARLDQLDTARLLRSLEARHTAQATVLTVNNRELINFTSNDYLGLAAHPRVVGRVRDELAVHGFGAGGAALLSGRSQLHDELERRIAAYVDTDRALMFSSGYLANTGALPALVGRTDRVFSDRLNHASLIDGIRASKAELAIYDHNTIPVIESPAGNQQSFIVTESLFSMDGDFADLTALARHAAATDSVLYVDDAHGFGVSGDGRGAAASVPTHGEHAALIMITLGKALGSVGAVITGPELMVEYLLQSARTFIFDTAPPAVCAAAALEALDILQEQPGLLRQLQDNIQRFQQCAANSDIPVLPSTSPIQPVVVGDEGVALRLASYLNEQGFYVRAVRPPTVPAGTSRIRVTLSAAHSPAQIDALAAAIGDGLRIAAAA